MDATATSTNNFVATDVLGGGSPLVALDANSIVAEGSYNRAASTIEVIVPADLQMPAEPASLVQVSGLSLTQEGSLNLLNLQNNIGFAASGTATASVTAGGITLLRNLQSPASYGGSASQSENLIFAEANGNTSDNSVFLREEIGGTSGSILFEGTVIVGNAQLNQQIGTDGIASTVTSVGISGFFGDTSDSFGGSIASADGLTLDMNGNAIEAGTTLNSSRQEINFDGGMTLSGPETLLDGAPGDVDAQSVFVGGGPIVAAFADYAAINQQTALRDAPGDPGTDPGTIGSAGVFDGAIELRVEDVAGDSVLSFDGNSITSNTTGNRGANLIGNVLPDSGEGPSTGIDATVVSGNSQYVLEPELSAITTSATIVANIGSLAGSGFGGFEGSSLSVDGNALRAVASGNVGISVIDFAAVSVVTAYSDGAATNGTAVVDADRGNLGGVFDNRITAGTSVINHQVTDNFASPYQYSDPSIMAQLTGSQLQVNVNAGDATNGAGLSGSVFSIQNNGLTAQASGNVFDSSTFFDADTTFGGSIGTLSIQADTGQNMFAVIGGVSLAVDVAAADDAASVENLTLDVAGNSVLALSTISSVSTLSYVEAGSFLGGERINADPLGAVFGSQNAVGGLETLRYSSLGQAGVATVTDQSNYEGDSSASSGGANLTVDLASDYDGGLSDVAANVALNTLGTQALGNEAVNAIVLDIDTTLGVETPTVLDDPAAIAGIVSVQANSHDSNDTGTPLAGVGTVIQASTGGNFVTVSTPGLSDATLDVTGNRVLANATGNLTANSLEVEALAIDGFAGASLEIAPNAGLAGQDLLAESSFFIVNSQRSEANRTTDAGGIPVTLGPTINASLGGNVIGVTVGDAATSAGIAVEGNALLATGRANDTSNVLAVSQGSGTFSAGILSFQGASGNMTVENAGSNVSLTLAGLGTPAAPANVDSSVTLDGNQIGSRLTGNNALNLVSAEAATGFGTAAGGSASSTGGGTADSNGAGEAFNDLVVLNSQRFYGAPDGGASALNSETVGGSIGLNVPGGLEGGTASVSDNRVQASATVNNASNTIQASTGTGSLPGATILSQQGASNTSATATVAGMNVTATIGGSDGSLLGGGATVSGNAIGSSASINNGVNTISTPGQGFTRTSSF